MRFNPSSEISFAVQTERQDWTVTDMHTSLVSMLHVLNAPTRTGGGVHGVYKVCTVG